MANMEKVIKGLEICSTGHCEISCPFHNAPQCTRAILSDALALLKEQEAVEPTFKQDNDGIFVWACGLCGAYMYHIYEGIDKAKEYAKYCRQCGRKVKWE